MVDPKPVPVVDANLLVPKDPDAPNWLLPNAEEPRLAEPKAVFEAWFDPKAEFEAWFEPNPVAPKLFWLEADADWPKSPWLPEYVADPTPRDP